MPQLTWSSQQLQQLTEQYPVCSDPRKLAEQLGKSYTALKSKAGLLQLKRLVPNANTGKTSATPEQDQFIRDHYLELPVKTMAKCINRSDSLVTKRMEVLGLIQPPELIEKFKVESQIKKGNVPMNKGRKQVEYMSAEMIERTVKTRFKKGNKPPNTKEADGVIVIRTDHSDRNGRLYEWIRIGLGKWIMHHRYIWEKTNGIPPKGMVVAFKDGNSLNCKLENLELISRKENMMRNTIQRYPDEVKSSIRMLSKLNKKIKHGEEQIK